MSIEAVTCYQVKCDELDCGYSTASDGEYEAYGYVDVAIDAWKDEGGVVTEDGRTFCEAHRPPICVDCDATADLAEDVPGGDVFCPEHITAAREARS